MKRFNKAEWIGFIFLAGWGFYLLHLLTRGTIVSFIHPKRVPLMWGTLLGMLILTFYQSTKLFTIPNRKSALPSYLPMGAVLICGVLALGAKETDRIFTTQQVMSQAVGKSNKSISQKTAAELTAADIMTGDDTASVQKSSGQAEEDDTDTLGDVQKNPDRILGGEIVLNDENYTEILSEIEANPSRFTGKKITIEGFVYRDKTFDKNVFVVARLFMVCCAADAQITGLMAVWDNSITLKNKQWIQAKGVLKTQTYNLNGEKSLIPIIYIQSAVKMKTPDNQYVYY